MILFKHYTTVKNSGLVHGSDVYRLGLLVQSPDPSPGMYSVHVERRDPNGTVSEAFLYRGDNLATANKVYSKYSGVQS